MDGFYFASFTEEWGFVGAVILFPFGVVIWRILKIALHGATNFETLYGVGVAVYFMAHVIVHIGMNIGVLPVTGLPLPFLFVRRVAFGNGFAALGILMGMRRYGRAAHRDDAKNEFVGVLITRTPEPD